MSNIPLRTKKAKDWAIDEISISAEHLYYQLKTITEHLSGTEKYREFMKMKPF